MRNIFAKSSATILITLLSACTVQIEDKRLPREEVAAAFKQRDEAITAIIEKLKQLEPTQPTEKKKDGNITR